MSVFYISMLETEEEKIEFADIYIEYKPLCMHIALKITRSNILAEEAVHNAFLSIIKNKDDILHLPSGNRKAKIIIIVRNKSIDLMRGENYREYTPFDENIEDEMVNVFDVYDIIECKESYNQLKRSINSLPVQYRGVLNMRYIYDKNNQEIADYFNIKPKAVSTRISRAKIMLLEMLNKGDD